MPETRANSRLADRFDWVRQNLQAPHTVDSMAGRAMMSRGAFTRQFKQLPGTNFLSWLHAERVVYAQRLLESTDASIDTVADKTGFGSAESLRVHFRRQVGIAPTWRTANSWPR